MLLFRAMSDKDLENYIKGNGIKCSLINSYNEMEHMDNDTKIRTKSAYIEYFHNKRAYSLNGMIGHVNGAKFKANRSPWISTSNNFDFIASEYAVPQSGNYNWSDKRKNIVLIDYDDSKIYSDLEDIKKLKEEYLTDFAVDLRDDMLSKLYDEDIIENEVNNGFIMDQDKNVIKTKITGINNFSTAASEILIFKEINNEDIKLIIYPILQDIIYSCCLDLNRDYDFIIANINVIYNVINKRILRDIYFKKLYPNISSTTNLTDILMDEYLKIPGDTIGLKYKSLKKIKTNKLNELVEIINNKLNTNWMVTRLIDDNIMVSNLGKATKLTSRQLNDVVLIESNGKVYKYNHQQHAYIDKNNDKITKDKILIKKI